MDPVSAFRPILQELTLLRRGKVRDVYEFGDHILLIATDRLSAFDVVLPTAIPMKGAVLTQLSRFWFDMMRDIVPNHMISADVDAFPRNCSNYRISCTCAACCASRRKCFPWNALPEAIWQDRDGRNIRNRDRSAESSFPPD